jgi:hypothetical protein
MADKPQSLHEFVAANPKVTGYKSWCDTLPDEIKAQILSAPDASATQILEWLHSIGYPDATHSRVDGWRRRNGRRSTGDV